MPAIQIMNMVWYKRLVVSGFGAASTYSAAGQGLRHACFLQRRVHHSPQM